MTSPCVVTWRVRHKGEQAAGGAVEDRVETVRLTADVGVAVAPRAAEVLPARDRLELRRKRPPDVNL